MSEKSHSKWHTILGGLLGAGVAALALLLLKRQLKGQSPQEILDSMRLIPFWQLAAATGFAALNYLLMGVYEHMVLRYIGKPLPPARLALGTFVGYSITNNLGWALGGVMGRYRLYTQWGMTTADVVKAVAMLGLTYWIGLHAFSGVLLMTEPIHLPEQILEMLHLTEDKASWLGVIFVIVTSIYVALCAGKYRKLTLFGFELELPPVWLVLQLLVMVALNLTSMGCVLYCLLPSEASVPPLELLNIFVFAMVAVYLAHVPGGIGVLEAVVLALLPALNAAHLTASLLAFRLVLFLVPLVISLIILLLNEVAARVEWKKD